MLHRVCAEASVYLNQTLLRPLRWPKLFLQNQTNQLQEIANILRNRSNI